MIRRTTRSWLFGLALPMAVLGGYSCSSSSETNEGTGGTKPSGAECAGATECASGACTDGKCATGSNLPDGAACSDPSECATDACTNGLCGTGTSGNPDASTGNGGGTGTGSGGAGTSGNPSTGAAGGSGVGTGGTGSTPPGGTCSVGSDCTSGVCTNGTCGGGFTTGPGGTPTTSGPHFDGTGSGFRPLTAGCGPSTATECTGTCEQAGGDPDVTVIRPPATLCFSGDGDATPDDPSVVIEQSIETLNGQTYVHLRVTFDPSFVDNTYGTGSVGWNPNRPHTFVKDLTGSDHTELLLTDGTGATAVNFKIDYVTADPSQTCGFGSLGVTGGDGAVITGDPAHILALSTSATRNLNACGYCENAACDGGACTVNSPTTDENFTANPGTPNWDYRAVYEVWIDIAAFGDAGFGQAFMTYVHASPSKASTSTINVTPTPCPPTWDVPYCPPSVTEEGGSCFGTPPPPGSGGATGAGGTTGGGGAGGAGGAGGGGGYTGAGGSTTGTPTPCAVNWQIYVSSEGQSTCTPIPFANYPGMTPCPAGYTLDLLSEGQYCLPNP